MGGLSISSSDMESHYRSRDYYGASSYYSGDREVTVTPRKKVTDVSQVLKSTSLPDEFNPAKIKLPREACDSAQSPHSRGYIYALDLTGSMGRYTLKLLQNLFPRLISLTYETVSWDPHIMFMGIGDVAAGDRAPLQVTQFETDIRMLQQLERIWNEGRGGGNNFESYILAWYFAAKYCKMDCFDKRGEKGFLFTFGDEEPTPMITPYELKRVFGDRDDLNTRKLTATDCLDMASEKFYCYHIILHGSGYDQYVVSKWNKLLGGHVCDLDNYEYLPELVSTIMKMYEGLSKSDALNALRGEAKNTVSRALINHEENVLDLKKSNNSPSNFEVF